MNNFELSQIKQKILSIEPSKYWGDDFDVRYHVISKLKETKNQLILDAGGGIGIITSDISKENMVINLDLNFNDLVICKTKTSKTTQNINGVMNFLPFRDSIFDQIICCHVLDVGKAIDIKNKNMITKKINRYPTMEKILDEFKRTLKRDGKLTLTVPNNVFYKKAALEYEELKSALAETFPEHSLYFFNTFPKLGNSRKLNLANMIPKIISKIIGQRSTLQRLLRKEDNKKRYSISFYVEATKEDGMK